MANKTKFRKRVMKNAWQIFRNSELSWRESILKAWELFRLARKMKSEVVKFMYYKIDGTIRKALGTLGNIPSTITKKSGKPSYKTMTYYDVEKHQFRCFRVENYIPAI